MVGEALDIYLQASELIGFRPDLAYNTALCFYHLKEYAQALPRLGEVIENGIRDHPELQVGVGVEGLKSIGNSQTLHKTFLVEAFNLKAAIEFHCGNCNRFGLTFR